MRHPENTFKFFDKEVKKMMKQVITAAAAALLCASAQAAYKDGTYVGEGVGNASHIQVQVTVAKGKVAGVKVLKHGETDMILGAAEKKLAKKIVQKNGTKGVDTVSGATNSSKGIIAAVNQALSKAK